MTTIYERLRREAFDKYYKNPSHCQSCGSVLYVPEGKSVSDVKNKKFCSVECRKSGKTRHADLSKFKNIDQRKAAERILKKIPISDIPETLKDIEILIGSSWPANMVKKVKAAEASLAQQNKIKKPRPIPKRPQAIPEINPFNKRFCVVCKDPYDIVTRRGKPGKLTECNDCAEETEERYRANHRPVGTSEGKNLHQWGMEIVKGGTAHKAKHTVG